MRLIWAALAISALLHGPAARAEAGWREVSSPHFQIISDGSASQARRIAQHFEQIRAAFRRALPDLSQDPAQPVLVIAVRDEAGFKALLPQFWEGRNRPRPAGVFLKGPERHYVVLRLDRAGSTRFRTVYHEYFHVLASLNFRRLPLWLNEGLAEFYSQTDFSGQRIQLGLPIAEHVALLRREPWIPLSVLFAADEDSPAYNSGHQVSVFYSQAWALVHYLTLGDPGGRRKPLTKLLTELDRGIDRRSAVRRALGDYDTLESNLRKYVEQEEFSFYRFSKPSTGAAGPVRSRVLTEAESTAWQALFLVRNERTVEARRLIERAINLDASEPVAHEAMGYLHYRAGRPSDALDSFAKAVALDSQSYLSHYYYGFLGLETGDLPREKIEAALRRAIELRPRFAYSRSTLATLFLRQGGQSDEALELARQAAELEPENPGILQTLVYALVEKGILEEAREVVVDIRRNAKSAGDREILRRLDDTIRRHQGFRDEASGQGPLHLGNLGEVAGAITSVNCAPPATLNLVIRTENGFRNFVSYDAKSLQYLAKGPGSETGFQPCRDLEGRDARIRFRIDADTGRERPVSIILEQRNP